MKKRQVTLPLLLILLSGFALRLYRLGAQSLWYDETVSVVLAQKAPLELIAHTARDIHPPGYYLLLHLWTRLGGDTEFALAFFSLGWGLLLVGVVYRLGARLVNRGAGIWAAALVAFSPYNIWYSQEVRMYTLGALLGAGALYWVLRGIGEPLRPASHRTRAGSWAAYAIISTLGLYALYYFGFLLAALNLFLLAGSAVYRAWRLHFKSWLLANLVIVALYLPWLGIAWRQVTNPPVPPWRSNYPLWTIALEGWSALSLGESVEPGQLWPVLLLTLALFGLGIFALSANWKRILLPLLTFGPLLIIIAAPLLGGSPLYHVRYLFTYSPPFYLVLGAGLAWLWTKQRVVTLLVGLFLAGGTTFSIYRLHTNPQYASDDLRGAVQMIQEKWRPGDVILVNAGYTYTAFRYYFSHPVDDYKRLTAFEPAVAQANPYYPLILQTGSVDGPPSLGWGDPRADFYAMNRSETVAALEAVSRRYPRIWMLRAYDTVTDAGGLIRQWLSENTLQFEDQAIAGSSHFRVQGFLTRYLPQPPQRVDFSFGDRFWLRGITPPAQQYTPGQTVHVAFWLQPLVDVSMEEPYALSLKLWDSAGNLVVQADEWPAGSLYFSPNWRRDRILWHPMRLILPQGIAPGRYWLDVQMYRTDSDIPLEVSETRRQVVTLGGFEVLATPYSPSTQSPDP